MLTALLKAFPEGARNPEKSMDAEESEGADQQAGHGPERIEQKRILIPVMMGGMGQISCELPVGPRVTFSAGFHHITPVQTGLTVIGRQDIMGSMTVGAFSRLLPTGKH